MSCYSPMVAQWFGEYTQAGKKKYKFVGKALDPRYKTLGDDMIYLPCGKCIGCRLDYSRQWADRMMLELETSGKGSFVTLTYDKWHLDECWSQYDENDQPIMNPLYLTLVKRHAQNFMKEVRRQFPDVRVRFFLSGEYGELHGRPHYHCILFGLSPQDFEGLEDDEKLELVGRNEMGQPYFTVKKLRDIWKKGFVGISEVSWQTCAYVARYCVKKLDGDMSDIYAIRNIIPEFSLCSRRPGIGADYFKSHPDCLEFSEIYHDGKPLSIPKYFLRLREQDDPDFIASLRSDRKKFAEDSQLLKLFQTDLRYDELMDVERVNKENATKILRRRKGVDLPL